MSDTTTNDVTAPDNGQGKNDETSKGTDTNSQKVPPTFTQEDMDRVIRQKQAEWKAKYQKEFEKTIEGKRVLTEDEIEKEFATRLESYKAEQALQTVKASIKTEYGLTEAQLERLAGANEKELRADAEKIYGVLKQKQAPKLTPGGTPQSTEANKELNDYLRSTLRNRNS